MTINRQALAKGKVQAPRRAKTVVKVIVVPGKLVNLVLHPGDKDPVAPCQRTQAPVVKVGVAAPLRDPISCRSKWAGVVGGTSLMRSKWPGAGLRDSVFGHLLDACSKSSTASAGMPRGHRGRCANPWVAWWQLAMRGRSRRTRSPRCAGCPVAAFAWVVVSGLGRTWVLKRMNPRLPFGRWKTIVVAGAFLVGW